MSHETLKLMRMLQRIHTARGTEYRVCRPTDLPTATTSTPADPTNAAPASPPPATTSRQRSALPPHTTSHPTYPVTCSSSQFSWLQRNVFRITAHLGVHLSPKPPSPIRSPPREKASTVKVEDSGYHSSSTAGSSHLNESALF